MNNNATCMTIENSIENHLISNDSHVITLICQRNYAEITSEPKLLGTAMWLINGHVTETILPEHDSNNQQIL